MLDKHQPWIRRLTAEHGTAMAEAEARQLLKQEVGTIFSRVLACCGVFKEDEAGQRAFGRFLQSMGFREQ